MEGFVYFIEALGAHRIKIGWAADPEERRRGLQTGSPVELVLRKTIATEDAPALERSMHERFASLRVHGEWFEYGHDLVQFLASEESPLAPEAPRPRKVPATLRRGGRAHALMSDEEFEADIKSVLTKAWDNLALPPSEDP